MKGFNAKSAVDGTIQGYDVYLSEEPLAGHAQLSLGNKNTVRTSRIS